MVKVPIIERSISLVANIVILGLNLWKTVYIFKADREIKALAMTTTKVAYHGNLRLLLI